MADGEAPRPRHFLFLQGPSSTIFAKTGRNLQALGHRVTRINICAGDWVFWHGRGTRNYRGSLADWPGYVRGVLEREQVTDLVLLGEERPHHKAAIAVAKDLGVEVTVVEMGYFRPDWITLERGGMSTNSHFPDDPALIMRLAQGLPAPDFTPRHSQKFWVDAASDLAFNLPNVFLWFFYPHYRWHALDHPLAEYGGWLRKFWRGSRRAAETRAALERVKGKPFFLYPLQLETDYQIRAHSPFASQFDAMTLVLEAFAAHAPATHHLVLKVHPLDNDLRDWAGHAAKLAERLGMAERVHFLHGGDLGALIVETDGVVTINSTVGLQALVVGRPVKLLGTALFDVEGMTDRRGLADFFAEPQPPRDDLRAAFVSLAASAIHVRGNFYSTAGTDEGAMAIAQRLHECLVNDGGAYVELPPRRNDRNSSFRAASKL